MINKASLMFVASEAVTYVTNHWVHFHINDYWSQAITGALVAFAYAVERDGIKGAGLRMWDGAKAVWNPAPVAAKK